MHYLIVLMALLFSVAAEARFGSAPEGWPCIQPYVAEVSAGAFWTAGELPEQWQDDEALVNVAEEVSDRSISYLQSLGQVQAFLAPYTREGPEVKREKAALLVVALTDMINQRRTQVLEVLDRFSRNQQVMIARVEKQNLEINKMENSDNPDAAALEELKMRQHWDIRIFEERESQKNYLCEQPVLLEQRFFLLGREIVAWLDK